MNNLKKLEVLFLDNNQFTGSIPTGLTNLDSLKWIFLEKNQFSGNLPEGFNNLTNLTYLSLYQNSFQGNLPENLDSLKELKWLLLHQNNFSGCLPSYLCTLNLDSLNLSQNMKLPDGGSVATIDSFCNNPTSLFGITCNDGNENTFNDIIQEDCTCKGEIMISVGEPGPINRYKICPNPVSDSFHLSTKAYDLTNIQILDLEGKIVLKADIGNLPSIEVQHLPAGKYILQIIHQTKGTETLSFVKL